MESAFGVRNFRNRFRERGSGSVESVQLVALVAVAGTVGFGLLGTSFDAALVGAAAGESARVTAADGTAADGAAADGSADGTHGFGNIVTSWGAAAEGNIPADGPTLPGIDVSHWQGRIDWDQVSNSDVEYAFIRVSDGVGTIDREFERNWAEAKRVGIARGAYQFFRPNQDPIAQAELFLEKMGPLGADDLPPVLDIEVARQAGVPPEHLVAGAKAWVEHVRAATGRDPIVYAGYYFWNNEAGGSDAFKDLPLWVPNYSAQWPLVPDPWDKWTFFQHSATGRVPGIVGDVDMNVFNGTLADLRGFISESAGAFVDELSMRASRHEERVSDFFERIGLPRFRPRAHANPIALSRHGVRGLSLRNPGSIVGSPFNTTNSTEISVENPSFGNPMSIEVLSMDR